MKKTTRPSQMSCQTKSFRKPSVLTIPSTGRLEFSRITRNFRYCGCCGERCGFSERIQNGVWPACYSSCTHTTKRRRWEFTHACTPTLTAAVFTLAQSQPNTSQLWRETLKPNQMAWLHTQKLSRRGKLTDSYSGERLGGGQTKLFFFKEFNFWNKQFWK